MANCEIPNAVYYVIQGYIGGGGGGGGADRRSAQTDLIIYIQMR